MGFSVLASVLWWFLSQILASNHRVGFHQKYLGLIAFLVWSRNYAQEISNAHSENKEPEKKVKTHSHLTRLFLSNQTVTLPRVCFDCFLADSLKNNLIEKDKRGSLSENQVWLGANSQAMLPFQISPNFVILISLSLISMSPLSLSF